MKIGLSILLLLIFNIGFSQIKVEDILHLQERPRNINEHCVQTIFNKQNNSSFYFQGFLHDKIGVSESGEPEYKLNKGVGTIKTTYTKSIIHGYGDIDVDAYKVYVQYHVFPIDNDFFVDKLDIWGNWETVANIFISYYPTTLNIENLKNNKTEITSYYIGDRAVFSSEIVNGRFIGRMKVLSTSGKDYRDFLSDYEVKKQEYIDKQKLIEQQEKIKLLKFLDERKETTYSIKKLDKKTYKSIEGEIYLMLFDANKYSSNIQSDFQVNINFDTTGYQSVKFNNYVNIPNSIIEKLRQISTTPPKLNSFFIKTSDTIAFKIDYTSINVSVVKRENKFIYKKDFTQDTKSKIEKYLYSKESGKYNLDLKHLVVNGNEKSNIDIVSFKKSVDKKKYLYAAVLIGGGIIYYLIQ